MSLFVSPIVEVISHMKCTNAEYDVDFKAGKKEKREGEREREREREKVFVMTIDDTSMKPTLRLVEEHLVKDPSKDKI